MKIDKSIVVASMVLAMSVIPALAQVYNYFSPGGALFGSATVQSVNLGSGTYITGNLPVTNLNGGVNASASTAWCGNGTWCAATGGATYATPTGLVGLTAVAGTATTGIRSDGTPALSQSITPTWTGRHIFNGTVIINASGSAQSLLVNGAANQQTMQLTGSATSGQSFGLGIKAGTTTADAALYVSNQSNSTKFLGIAGDGSITTNGRTNEGLGSVNATSLWIQEKKIGASATTTFSAGIMVGGTSTCGLVTAYNTNITSCSGTSGAYTVIFTTPYTQEPVCTANIYGVSSGYTIGVQGSTGSASVNIYNGSGTLAGAYFNLLCFGT